MKLYLLILLLLVCSNCLHKSKIGPEYPQLQEMTEIQTGTPIFADSAEYQSKDTFDTIEQMLERGITRNEAITIALLNNKTLQAKIEDLGIARSELVQASLFSNPIFSGDALFPYQVPKNVSICENKKSDTSLLTNVELFGYYNLSDLWNVLLRKNVARDVLQITIWDILSEVFNTIRQTRRAYDDMLYAQNLIEISKKNVEQITDTRKIIEKNSKSVVLATDFAAVRLGRWKAYLVAFQANLAAADVNLKKMMGLLLPPSEPIKLTTPITAEWFNKLPNVVTLQAMAMRYRPELQQARMLVKKYEDQVRLEKGQIFNNVNAGFSWETFSDGSKFAGPAFLFTLPAFNQNQGNISAAYYLHTQAQKRVIDLEIAVKAQVFELYTVIYKNIQQIDVYKSFIPQNEHLLETAQKRLAKVFSPSEIDIQLGAVVSGTAFYEIRLEYMDLYYDALDALSQLEQAVGRRLDIDLPIDPDLISQVTKPFGALSKEITRELTKDSSQQKVESESGFTKTSQLADNLKALTSVQNGLIDGESARTLGLTPTISNNTAAVKESTNISPKI